MSIDPDTFRSVLGRFASGVTIITTRDENGLDHGMTVSAFSALSLTPPLVLACIDRSAGMHNVLRILGRRGTLPVTVRLLEPLDRSGDRKQLAAAARTAIAASLGFKLGAGSPIGLSE